MPAARPPHPDLIKFCRTEKQAQLIKRWVELGSAEKVAAEFGYPNASNLHHTLRRIKDYAVTQGHNGPWYLDEDEKYESQVLRVVEYETEKVTIAEEHKLKKQLALANQQNRELAAELGETQTILDLLDKTKDFEFKAPSKTARKKSKKPIVHAGAMLSDTHFDEVVSEAEMGGYNVYNRQIATQRLDCFFEKILLMSNDYMSGFQIDGLTLCLGGDLIGGNIHEELMRTNDAEIMDTCLYWSQRIAEGIQRLSTEFKSIYCPVVVGNHGRNTKKPRMKGRVADNFDFLLCKTVQNMLQLQGIKNVTFDIPMTFNCAWKTYGYQFYMEHGDATRGGSGWGGMFSPIMRLVDKRITSFGNIDYWMCGHWHSYNDMGNVMINGSLKGYDEYARISGFKPEPPQQAYWLLSPDHGKIVSAGIFVDD